MREGEGSNTCIHETTKFMLCFPEGDCGYLKGFDALQQNEVFIPWMRLKVIQGLSKEITIKELNVFSIFQLPIIHSVCPPNSA